MTVRLLASVVLALEALGVAALFAWQVMALFAGDTASVATAVALAVITILGAVALGAFAVATARGSSWGRSGGIVAQVLILAIALGALTGIGADPLLAGAIALPGLVGGVLLVIATRQAAPPRDPGQRDS